MSRSGLKPSCRKLDQIGDEGGRHELVVPGTAAVKIAILFRQFERIVRPILPACRDNVEVSQQQNRAARAGTAKARDKISFLRRRREHLNVGFGKAGLAQSRCHGVGRARRVARSRSGIDLDQLFVDVERQFSTRCQCLGGIRRDWSSHGQSCKTKQYEDVFGAAQPPRDFEHHFQSPQRFALA